MARPFDIVVIGGGVIGLAIAWRSARSGMTVSVIDENPGAGASWAAAGMLAPVTEIHYGEDELLQLNLESARRYPGFVAELEQATDRDTLYRRAGTLLVARDADDHALLDDVFAYQVELGLEVERLRSRATTSLEPALNPSIRSGILVPGDHQIDNRAFVGALLAACDSEGVDLVREEALEIVPGGVRTAGGTWQGEVVVIAAGCRSGTIPGAPDELRRTVRPVKGQLVHLKVPGGTPIASRNIRGADCYIVPRPDGRVVVGATVEERGFDETVTAGATFELLRAAYELLPGIAELELTETVAGLRPGTPDNAPLLGWTSVSGVLAATGHYRNGVLLTPVTADSVLALTKQQDPPIDIDPFAPTRFAGGGLSE